jgi:hypothetical protein
MNVRTNSRELDRIRRDVGAALRTEREVVEPVPPCLVALLRVLEARALDAERERLFGEIDVRIAELIRVARREPEVTLRANTGGTI